MTATTEPKSQLQWEDIVLSFVPAAKRTSKQRKRLAAYRLPVILAIQAALTWRLADVANDDEALYINVGHAVIGHLLHGGAENAAFLRLYGTYLSGAPNAYPVVEAALDSVGGLPLVRLFSLFSMLIANFCVYKIGRRLFTENVALLASLVFVLIGSVQFIGKLATYDAPCLALVAMATAVAITTRSLASAPVIGVLLALASVTKYTGLALVPFVLVITFLSTLVANRRPWRETLPRAVLRATTTVVAFAGLLLIGYRLWGSGIAVGVKFTTTGRQAIDPQPTSVLLKSLLEDIGLAYAMAIGGILLMLRRRLWDKSMLFAAMLGAGSVIQASSLRIHEFTSLDKHTAFSGLFVAVPAAVALDWALSKRGRTAPVALAALAVIWLLLIDGMWRSNIQYSWPALIMEPINEIKTLNISGEYFSFDADAGAYYTQKNQAIEWYPAAEAYSIFGQGLSQVIALEKSHELTGFMFRDTDLSPQALIELRVLDQLLSSDPYYFKAAAFPVSPYTKAIWQLWIHYPPGYHGPSLKAAANGA